jgi:hypothetical protein
MSLHPFFHWCDSTAVAEAIRSSRFIFPVLESIHLFALTVLLGTVVVLSLRLLGAGLRGEPIAAVGRMLAPLTLWSLLAMVATGGLLFCSEAMKCYENPPFWAKMQMLAAAILFHFTFVRWTVRSRSAGPMQNTAAALGSLALWFGVGAAGRAIGFY